MWCVMFLQLARSLNVWFFVADAVTLDLCGACIVWLVPSYKSKADKYEYINLRDVCLSVWLANCMVVEFWVELQVQ